MKTPESIALEAIEGLEIPELIRTELILRVMHLIVADRHDFNDLLQARLAVSRMTIDKFRIEAEGLLMS